MNKINYISAKYLPVKFDEDNQKYLYEIYMGSQFLFDKTQISKVAQVLEDGSENELIVNITDAIPEEFTGTFSMAQIASDDPTLNIKIYFNDYPSTFRGMFRNCSMMTEIDLSNCDTRYVTDMYSMFHNNRNLKSIDFSVCDTSSVSDTSYMFSHDNIKDDKIEYSRLTSINLTGCDFSNVTTMSYMFNNCLLLEELKCDNVKTSDKLLETVAMFRNCLSMREFNIDWINTSNVSNINYMFASAGDIMATTKLHDKRKLIKFGNYPVQNILIDDPSDKTVGAFTGWYGIVKYPAGRDYDKLLQFLHSYDDGPKKWVDISYEIPIDVSTKFLDINGLEYNNKKLKKYIEKHAPTGDQIDHNMVYPSNVYQGSFNFAGYQYWYIDNPVPGVYGLVRNQLHPSHYIIGKNNNIIPLIYYEALSYDNCILLLDMKHLSSWSASMKVSCLAKLADAAYEGTPVYLSIAKVKRIGPTDSYVEGVDSNPYEISITDYAVEKQFMGNIESYEKFSRLECELNYMSIPTDQDYKIILEFGDTGSAGIYLSPLNIITYSSVDPDYVPNIEELVSGPTKTIVSNDFGDLDFTSKNNIFICEVDGSKWGNIYLNSCTAASTILLKFNNTVPTIGVSSAWFVNDTDIWKNFELGTWYKFTICGTDYYHGAISVEKLVKKS